MPNRSSHVPHDHSADFALWDDAMRLRELRTRLMVALGKIKDYITERIAKITTRKSAGKELANYAHRF